MKSAGRPIINALRGRLYSAQAAAKESAQQVKLTKQAPQVTKLGNGMSVVSVENYSPICRLSVVVNTGPRDETRSEAGLTHCIRSAAHLTSDHASTFKVTNMVQQLGGNLMCTTNREQLYYTIECTRDNIDEAVEILRCISTEPSFFPWELDDVAAPRMKYDLALIADQPQVSLLESLHSAAYRDTLGRSLYSPANKVGRHSSEMLKNFASKHFVGNNFALSAVGVDHERLLRLAKPFKFATSDSSAPRLKSMYFGGQCRTDTNSDVVHVAIAGEGAQSGKEGLALAVLQKFMGSGAHVKYGNDISRLSKAVAQATSNPYAVSCLNVNYSDSGLFGFYSVMAANDADKVLKALMSHMKAMGQNITDKDLDIAKHQLKASLLMELENTDTALESMGAQVLNTGVVETNVEQQVDSITLKDVQTAAQNVLSKPPTMAAVGNLSNTPYLDELL